MLEDITEDDLAGKSGSPKDMTVEETTPVTLVVEVRRSHKVITPLTHSLFQQIACC